MAISLRDLAPFMVPFATATDRAEANARMFGIGDQRRRTGIMARQAEQAAELARQRLALDTKDKASLIKDREASQDASAFTIARQREADRRKREEDAFDAARLTHEAARAGDTGMEALHSARFEALGGSWKDRETPDVQREQMHQAFAEIMQQAQLPLAPPGPLAQPKDPSLQLQSPFAAGPAPSAFGLQLQPPGLQPMPEPPQQIPQAPLPMQAAPAASVFPELQLQAPLAPPPAPPPPPPVRRIRDAYLGGKRIYTLDPQEAAAPNPRAREALDMAVGGVQPPESRAELGGWASAIAQTERNPAKAVSQLATIWGQQERTDAAQARLGQQEARERAMTARYERERAYREQRDRVADRRARRAEKSADRRAQAAVDRENNLELKREQNLARGLFNAANARIRTEATASKVDDKIEGADKFRAAKSALDSIDRDPENGSALLARVISEIAAANNPSSPISNKDYEVAAGIQSLFGKTEDEIRKLIAGDRSGEVKANLRRLVEESIVLNERAIVRRYESLQNLRNEQQTKAEWEGMHQFLVGKFNGRHWFSEAMERDEELKRAEAEGRQWLPFSEQEERAADAPAPEPAPSVPDGVRMPRGPELSKDYEVFPKGSSPSREEAKRRLEEHQRRPGAGALGTVKAEDVIKALREDIERKRK